MGTFEQDNYFGRLETLSLGGGVNLKDEQKDNWSIIISYFDKVIGPRIFFCDELKVNVDVGRILDLNDREGEFFFAFSDYMTLNYLFHISSELARGGFEIVMITYLIGTSLVVNVYDYLRSKVSVLERYANELKELKDFAFVLNNFNNESDRFLPNEFKKQFFFLYDKYSRELTQEFIQKKDEIWHAVRINCPDCLTEKSVDLPESIFRRSESEAIVLIDEYRFCRHCFVVSIGRDFKQIDSRKISFKYKALKPEIDLQDIDIGTIKKGVSKELLTLIVHECLFKREILIFVPRLRKQLQDFLVFIFQDSFEIDVVFKSKRSSRRVSNYYKNRVLIDGTKRETREHESMAIVREFVARFFGEKDEIMSIITLKEKMNEIFYFSKRIYDYSERKESYIRKKSLTRYLVNNFYIRIKKDLLVFLTKIVEQRYGIKIRWFGDRLAEYIEQLWGNRSRELTS